VEPIALSADLPRGRLRRFLALTAVIALVHGIVTATCISIAFSAGMARFDHPEIRLTYWEQGCGAVADVLMQPGERVWERLGITPRSAPLEWAALLLNSLVWGATIALFVSAIRKTPRLIV
jgi:hypothetical protein